MPRSTTPAQQLTLYPEFDRSRVFPAVPPHDEAAGEPPLPGTIRLGASSWAFPGWRGSVWRDRHDARTLSRTGLTAYASHPWLRAVGLDRTYYEPMAAAELRNLAAQVPRDFRFLVKAYELCTRPELRAGGNNSRFLDASYAADTVIAPYMEGLGENGGALVFQFPRFQVRSAQHFLERLERFLAALPRGPRYAVELRNPELVTEGYQRTLAATGTIHCYNVHPQALPLARQCTELRPVEFAYLVVRWMLHPGLRYDAARRDLEPFDELRLPDAGSRGEIAKLIADAHAAGREVLVTVNNKAEGSAPLSVRHLRVAVAARLSRLR